MPYLFADSYGGLGQANLAEEQNRRIALAQAMSAFQQGMSQQRQGRQFQQQLQMERDKAAADQQYRTGELGMRGAEIARQSQNDADRNAIAAGSLGVQQQYANWQTAQPTATQDRQNAFEFSAAGQDANTGAFDNPDHVRSLYPTLNDSEANIMANRSLNARRQIQAEHDVAQHAADTMNKWNFLTKQQSAAKTSAGQAHSYAPWTTDAEKSAAQNVDQINKQVAQIAPVAMRIQGDKRINSLINYDPDSDSYVPAIPTQPWMQGGSTGSTTAGTGPAQPTSRPAPTVTGTAPAAGAPAGRGYQPQRSPRFYSRVNELIGSGYDPVSAKRQAIAEDEGF